MTLIPGSVASLWVGWVGLGLVTHPRLGFSKFQTLSVTSFPVSFSVRLTYFTQGEPFAAAVRPHRPLRPVVSEKALLELLQRK